MRILQLCKKFPYPPKDGEAIAILNLTKSLAELGHDVTVLAMNTKKHYFNIDKLPPEIRNIANFYAVDINTEINAIDAVKNLFSSRSYNIERFVSLRYKARLIELLTENEFDVVHLETVYLAPYIKNIRKYSSAVVALRAHNVEHEIWERLAKNQNTGPKKWYLNLLARRLKNFEISSLDDCDLMVPISSRDEIAFKNFGWKKASFVLPTGIDLKDMQFLPSEKESPSVFFIGGMDWLPNVEGLQWFLNVVWSKLNNRYPGLKFYIAGRNMPQWMLDLKIEGLEVLGEVDDAHIFMRSKSIMVVPLFSGSGMRIKIIEAMALGKAIISTTIGAEGIEYTDGENIAIANDEHTFIARIVQMIKDKEMVNEMGKSARKLIEIRYDNLHLTKQLTKFYQNNLPV